MNLNNAIYERRSVRSYRPDPISETTIRQLIDGAIQAPSAINRQPWGFTVVRSQQLLDQISQASKAHLLAAAPPGGISEPLLSHLRDPQFQIFYRAPVLIVISADGCGP